MMVTKTNDGFENERNEICSDRHTSGFGASPLAFEFVIVS